MENKKFLIFGFIIIFAVAGVCLWSAFKMKKEIGLICHEDKYSLISYINDYVPKEDKPYLFISSQKDLEQLNDIFTTDDINILDIEKYDYLIYFFQPQHGCDRNIRLNCVEYDQKGINLKLDSYNINQACDAIFHDSIVVEIEKNKYDNNLEVTIKND